MADYVIGDIQGCYDPLRRLLEQMQFDPLQDTLWLVGDLVNRGPDSLGVLRFLKQLPSVIITLGNHDLYALVLIFTDFLKKDPPPDSLKALLQAPDVELLGNWLRQQSLLHYDAALNVLMCHAGWAPQWTFSQLLQHAKEVENVLRGPQFPTVLSELYGNEPACWSDTLTGVARIRCIVNYLTRLRFCDAAGGLVLDYKGTREEAPAQLIPWFEHPLCQAMPATCIVGHWSALGVLQPKPFLYNLDTGCVWGRALTGIRLQDRVIFSEKGYLRTESLRH